MTGSSCRRRWSGTGWAGPAHRHDRGSATGGRSERDFVVQIAALWRVPGWAATACGAAGGTGRCCLGPLPRGISAAGRHARRHPLGRAAIAAFATARAGIEHGELAVEAADHDLGGIALLAL